LTPLEDLLQQCTVKITVPGGWGTGFFVAPGLILTCAHVVRKAADLQVTVSYPVWQQPLSAIVKEKADDGKTLDLALVELSEPLPAHPCVLLDEEPVAVGQALYSYGYLESYTNAAPVRPVNEGLTGDTPPLLKLQGAQIERGLSGAALLNLKSGKVCGMVKETRAAGFDLGGGAIPTRVILEQFPELRSLQQAFHGGVGAACPSDNRRWINLITPPGIDFQPYREAVIDHYSQQCHLYTPTDALLPLEARSVERQAQDEGQKQQPEKMGEPFPVLDGLRKYALGTKREHVLLAGRPGSGKSTTLRQLAVSLAEEGQVPVLVQLKGDRPVPDLIQAEFRRRKQRVTSEQIDEWLLDDRLVLLLDGVNEIPSDGLRRKLAQFRDDNLMVPMIFTTRDLSLGGNLGIGKHLEMKPLAEPQMREFVGKYLPEQGDHLLKQLRDRLRELAETPLLLKMLCDVFQQTGEVPQSKGELFRRFDAEYERFKGLPAVSADFRRFKSELLQHLAWMMMQGDEQRPTEFALTLNRTQAEKRIEQWLNQRVSDPATKAKEWLEDLLEHHLLQVATDSRHIEFHHQLFQEYYAAEVFLTMFHDRDPQVFQQEQLQQNYLNYLKWTEVMAILLSLMEDEAQALEVVRSALEVDLILGAKLAGNLQSTFQEQAVNWVIQLTVPPLLGVTLLATTRSQSVVPALLKALKDQSLPVRARAIYALGDVGGDVAMSALYEALEDHDAHIRWMAADALKNIGGEVTIPVLIKALHDQNSFVRWMAADALGKVSDEMIVPHLLKALKDQDADVRDKVAKALKSINSEAAVSVLLKALEDRNNNVRLTAIEVLGIIGGERALSALIKALEDRNNNVRLTAIEALGTIGSKKAIPALLKTFQNRERDIRLKAVEVLGEMGGEEVIPPLLKALKHRDYHVRVRATYALGEIGDEIAVLPLLEALKHWDSRVRARAAYGLGAVNLNAVHGLGLFNENSRIAIHPLLQALKDRDSNIRSCAAFALGMMGDEAVVPALIKALKDRACEVRSHAAYALGKLRNNAAVPALLNAIQDSERRVRFEVLSALGEIADKAATCALINALEDPDSGIRWIAVQGLKNIGDELTVPTLIKTLQDDDFSVRADAVRALAGMSDEVAIPNLLKALETHDPIVCEAASGELARLGSPIPLSQLWQICLTGEVEYLRRIADIQNCCKFYNYEIFQAHLVDQKADPQTSDPNAIIIQALEGFTIMTDKSLIFNQQHANIGVNYAAEGSKVEFTQYASSSEQTFEILLSDYQQFIQQLQQKYSTLADATTIPQIIEVEVKLIEAQDRQRWQNFLNLKRLWNGSKKAGFKIGEHFAEDNPWGKMAIAFLEGVSEDEK
jgi:HEAT repeat protein/energy-coupling factor transporter ATP-binding protein EcfA2